MSEDERAIHALIDRWMAATKAGDTGGVLDLMTDDVVFMVPGRVPFGKQEFAAMSGSHQGLRIDGNAESPIARGVERRLGNCAKPIIERWSALPAQATRVSHPTQPAARPAVGSAPPRL